MKIFLSVDMEGVTGVTDWPHVSSKKPDYKEMRELMAADTNAAIEGALEVGAKEIVVNDAHDLMGNLLITKLHPKARLISGPIKPLGMMQGVEGADAAMFIGYHARMGTHAAVLDHTFFGGAMSRVYLNEREVGEAEMNAILAGHFGVPVVLVSGGETMCQIAKAFIGSWLETVVVKRGITRIAAECLHPEVTQPMLKAAAQRALERLSEAKPTHIDLPVRLDVEFQSSGCADAASLPMFFDRTDARTVSADCATVLEAYRALETLGWLGSVPMLLRLL